MLVESLPPSESTESSSNVVQELRAEIERLKQIDLALSLRVQFLNPQGKVPTKDGTYVVRHFKYGWCIWGFSTKQGWQWGPDGNEGKITEWRNLDEHPVRDSNGNTQSNNPQPTEQKSS